MGRLAWMFVVAGGCGFQIAPGEGPIGTGPDAAVGSPDAAVAPDASNSTPDAPPPSVPLFAASNQMLHRIDVDTMAVTVVGPIAEAGGSSFNVAGLAMHGSMLLGLAPGGGELLTIDPTTATVTARTPVLPVGPAGGLTVAPAGTVGSTAIVFAGGDFTLRRIDPTSGTITTVGLFGQDLRFFSDLAWVDGQGLFATLHGGVCATVCFAKIDPTTGTATVFRSNLNPNIFGLSGYRGQLWALNAAGPVLTVNMTSGAMSLVFDPSIAWTEAAQ